MIIKEQVNGINLGRDIPATPSLICVVCNMVKIHVLMTPSPIYVVSSMVQKTDVSNKFLANE